MCINLNLNLKIMKKQFMYLNVLLLAGILMISVNGCKVDEDPVALTLSTLMAGSIDLNGSTAPNNVATEPIIVATFSTDVDATTAAANFTLLRDYDNTTIATTISVTAATVTITPSEMLASGALHKLTIGTGLKATNGQLLAASVIRTFSTDGFFAPTGMVAHWNFEDNANDQVGSYNASAAIDIVYVAGRKSAAGKAADFNGTTSIIEVPNGDKLIDTDNFTISFWMKTNSADKTNGHFVIGLGAFYGIQFEVFGGYDGAKFAIRYNLNDTATIAEDMWFPSDATYADNGGWQGWDFAKAVPAADMMAMLKDKWLFVTYTYNAVEKSGKLYYNGEKMKSFDFDLWPDGDAKRVVSGLTYAGVAPEVVNELAFGFIQSRAGTLWDTEGWGGYDFPGANHFKGQLDDIRIFNKTLSQAEVELMYNSEKP